MLSPVSPRRPKVYCAGPLFCESERREMADIADLLVADGYRVYLPHRDGMEFRLVHEVLVERNWEPATAAAFLHAGIFALDVYQLAADCDAMVWNLNGRVPDEGAVSEAAIAWTLGKPLIAYKDDVRSLITGRDNPLLVGLVDFTHVETLAAIPDALAAAIETNEDEPPPFDCLPAKLRRTLEDGRRLWEAMTDRTAARDETLRDTLIADVIEELFAPREAAGV